MSLPTKIMPSQYELVCCDQGSKSGSGNSLKSGQLSIKSLRLPMAVAAQNVIQILLQTWMNLKSPYLSVVTQVPGLGLKSWGGLGH